MSETPGALVPKAPDREAGTFLARIGETAKTVITAVDQIKRLEREDERAQAQIRELTHLVVDLAKSNAELRGIITSLEKRLDDKEKFWDVLITVRVRDELAKARGPSS